MIWICGYKAGARGYMTGIRGFIAWIRGHVIGFGLFCLVCYDLSENRQILSVFAYPFFLNRCTWYKTLRCVIYSFYPHFMLIKVDVSFNILSEYVTNGFNIVSQDEAKKEMLM